MENDSTHIANLFTFAGLDDYAFYNGGMFDQ